MESVATYLLLRIRSDMSLFPLQKFYSGKFDHLVYVIYFIHVCEDF